MSSDVLRAGRMALNVLWVVLAVAFVLPGGGMVATLRAVFVVLLAAPAREFLGFHRKLPGRGGSFGHHLVQTLLYGFFHIRRVELESETGSEPR